MVKGIVIDSLLQKLDDKEELTPRDIEIIKQVLTERKKHDEYKKLKSLELYTRRRALGQCTRCRQKAAPNSTLCRECGWKQSEQQAKYRKKRAMNQYNK